MAVDVIFAGNLVQVHDMRDVPRLVDPGELFHLTITQERVLSKVKLRKSP